MKTLRDIHLPEPETRALGELKSLLTANIPSCEIILYGMLPKSEVADVTELDLLVLISTDVTEAVKAALREAKMAIELRHDVILSVMLANRTTWKKELIRSLPGHWNLNEDGILL